MKLWHFAALAAVLGIAYVLISRPTIKVVGASPASSNAQLTSLATSALNFGTKLFSSTSKATPPGAVVDNTPASAMNQGTYYTGSSDVEGNTLTGEQGQTLVYGTD